ncbi:MAG TPA: glycosyltransferase family 4 protein [Aliidongia sp.]|uniref:glycosyltransferase family 4 protein n=1 Tax=Aliidongia sp. TaxID=1914230 RepID=UPI002DDD1782|nr:glycosyltransferase family 4 protein [Aliidongia sp.]HEV2674595.1 glycosyltransferase family 4 protein [Aliidongia sp.]
MKLLHITSAFPPSIGGVETFVADLSAWQAANGVFATVVAGSTDGDAREEHHNGVPLHRLPFVDVLGRQDLGDIMALRRRLASFVASQAPDVIHLHPVAAEMIFMRDVAKAAAVPVVTTLHVDIAWQPAAYQTNLRGLLARSDRIVAVSRPMLENAAQTFPDLAGQLRLVENGMPWRDPSADQAEPAHFLYLGRLAGEKGVDIALRAVALLTDRIPALHLTIAGDGPERAALEALTEALGLGERVSFLGQVGRDRISTLMARHVALLVPSRWEEPFGLVAIEAAMAGRPAIVSISGALPILVEHGVTGLHVERDDPEALADAMIGLVQAPARAALMGRAAAGQAATKWSIARCGEAYGRIYAEAIGAKPGA